MNWNDTIQWITVGVIVVLAVIFLIKRIYRDARDGCGSCELKDNCNKRKNNKKFC